MVVRYPPVGHAEEPYALVGRAQGSQQGAQRAAQNPLFPLEIAYARYDSGLAVQRSLTDAPDFEQRLREAKQAIADRIDANWVAPAEPPKLPDIRFAVTEAPPKPDTYVPPVEIDRDGYLPGQIRPVKPAEAKPSGLPDDNPKTRFGVVKPSMSVVPPAALLPLMAAMRNGSEKYGAFNWRRDAVSSTIYYDAAMRHLLAWFDGEDKASDSAIEHLGHVMACCAILLDALSVGKLNDDRPAPGRFAEEAAARTLKA